MMNLKKAYYYLFYKLYRIGKMSAFLSQSEWIGFLLINIICFFFVFSLFNYFSVVFSSIRINDILFYIMYGLICIYNFVTFHLWDQWKKIIQEFNKLPEKEKCVWDLFVYLFIGLIL